MKINGPMPRWLVACALMLLPLSAAGWAAQGSQTALERQASSSNAAVAISDVTYRGRAAVRVVDRLVERVGDPLIHIPVTNFSNGVIEAEVAGAPAAGAPADVRGFIGIAFRVQQNPARYEAFYIRPTNGRAEDQLRRNHSTQYVGMPDFPWHRLRKEHQGLYESYADMAPGEWTKLRIEVSGAKARLYVNGAAQPALIVNDLKLGADARGRVALWVGPGTDGYFSNVTVTAN